MIHALLFLLLLVFLIPLALSVAASLLFSAVKKNIKQGFSSSNTRAEDDDKDEFYTESPLNTSGEIGRTKTGRRRLDLLKNRAVPVNFDEDFS